MRYRNRQNKKVTHQGSSAELITADFTEGKIKPHEDNAENDCYYCHFCGKNKSVMLRSQFLGHQIQKNQVSIEALAQGP